MMFVLCACAACNDDRNEETPLNQVVAGKYDRYTETIAQYFPTGQYVDKQDITLTANRDGTVNVTYISDSFGELTINNATVKSEGDTYALSGKGETVMIMTGKDPKVYDYTLEGTIDTTKAAPSFEISVSAVMGGLTITFTRGETPAAAMVAGSYVGYTKAIAQYFPDEEYAADQTIRVTANEDGTVSATYTSDSFGEFTVSNMIVKSESNAYTLSGEGETVVAMAGKDPRTYDYILKGTIDVAKAAPSFEISMPAVMGGLTITFTKGDVSVSR